MTPREPLTDQEIQDYIDDRLDRAARAAVFARLRASPTRGAQVVAMRRQQEALRQIGQEVLHEPVPLRLRRILQADDGAAGPRGEPRLRQMRRFGLTTATAVILAGCVAI